MSTAIGTLTRDFEWLHRRPDARSRAIGRRCPEVRFCPDREVYELDNKYFVVDGHHRVRAAKRIKSQEFPDANVTRLIPRQGIFAEFMIRIVNWTNVRYYG